MPIVGFLLIAFFGILFVGCGPSDGTTQMEDAVFTEEDMAKYRELAGSGAFMDTGTGTMMEGPDLTVDAASGMTTPTEPVILDLSFVPTYKSIRQSTLRDGQNTYRVINDFLNVREQPNVTAKNLGRLERGDPVEVAEFVNAAWAKVTYNGAPGFVAVRYIGKVVSDDKLAAEKKQYEGMWFVDFGFVNVRKDPNSDSEKLGELTGQTFVRPVSVDGEWAQIIFEGKQGYVSRKYLSPFLPSFLVRQEVFPLPVLTYRVTEKSQIDLLIAHVERLKTEGYRFMTMRELREILIAQLQKDTRLPPRTVAITITDASPQTAKDAADALVRIGVRATMFLETKHLGLSGITEKQIMTMVANGLDIQSGTHMGDDLRGLTNAQVQLEFNQSRKLLEEFAGRTIFAVAYPGGGVNDRVLQYAASGGYLVGIASEDSLRASPTFTRDQLLSIPGLLVTSSMTAEDILTFVRK
jgi:peptidoglycan/xylan/chitin deacetylase (PgdA/CDA1 family)/uncharacterized protein YgiM (DUF1202 family)